MKRKSVKIVALALSLICCFSTAALLTSAQDQTITFDDPFYTSETGTQASYTAVYSGTYEGVGHDDNGGSVFGSTVGGPVSEFETTVMAQINIGYRVTEERSSVDTGSNSVSAIISFNAKNDNIIGTVNGYTEHICQGLSNSRDIGMANSLMYWNNNQDGWHH